MNPKEVLSAADYAPIVVVIPSFKCDHLMSTVLQLYEVARYPLRVHVAVLEHTSPVSSGGDNSVANMVRQRLELMGLYIWASNVTWNLQPQAWGPAHARAMACTNYKPFKYALHIHAHTQFEQHWDSRLIEDYETLLLRYVGNYAGFFKGPGPAGSGTFGLVLTTYPDEHTWQYMRFQSQPHAGYKLPMTEVGKCHGPENKRVTLSTAVWCDKFSFGHASIHDSIPFDAGLKVIADCVDVVYAARLCSAGIKLLHPPHTYMTHIREHGSPTFWQGTTPSTTLRAAEQVSQRRLKCQLGLLKTRSIMPEMKELPPVLEPYQLETYGRLAGINFGTNVISASAAWGLTPFTAASEYFHKTGRV